MARQLDPLVVIEVDLWTGAATQTLRLSNDGRISGVRVDPRLDLPFEIGTRIVADQYGDVLRGGGANGGSFQFALGRGRLGAFARTNNPEMWAQLALSWAGRPVRVYQGVPGQPFVDFDLVYTGRVDDLSHDLLRATVKLGDSSLDLDAPLVSDLYANDDSVPEAIRNRPRPEVRGPVDNLAPVLLSDSDKGAPLVYEVSRLPLDDIPEVRVAGIPWTRVATDPGAGEWSPDLAAGKLTLGGITKGGDVRCDARGIGWATLTAARLLSDFVTEAGGTVDSAAMAVLAVAAPYLVGWYTGTEVINRLTGFDQIATGIGGWWTSRTNGAIAAGVLDAPAIAADLSLTANEIADLQLIGILPPVWRIPVEHTRNWAPSSSFAEAVTETDKQRWEKAGVIAEAWADDAIRSAEPRAIDMPLLRSLVRTEADAIDIRDRLARAFGVSRRLYDVKIKEWSSVADGSRHRFEPPSLYGTAAVDCWMVSGQYRLHAVTRSFGGGPTTLQLWG